MASDQPRSVNDPTRGPTLGGFFSNVFFPQAIAEQFPMSRMERSLLLLCYYKVHFVPNHPDKDPR
ncbi:hypothetical protein Pla52o_17190 [Novipirellula galeiformis]|uniref:Uncharacterized protein n=1 Tax=Novipirellula galeiformis TaxID=2528004 RepID=A0A5C6CLT5_9BACT|nr:hypothetical protein Pla52o_17190 [Novipirellula galeiformis]